MKIGIFTLPLHTNYGGVLQAFALQKTLKSMGYEAWLIHRKNINKLSIQKALIAYPRRIIRKFVLGREDAIIFLERQRNKEFPIISAEVQKFIDQNIQPTLKIKCVNEIPRNYFDAIVVGSDQIWRPRYSKPKIENAFLDFAQNWKSLKRIAYGASFGTTDWEYNKSHTENCGKLVRKFDAISVRENSGVDLCKSYLNVEAKLVLDPTMLLDISEYMQLAHSCLKEKKGDMFVYFLDESSEKQKVIDEVTQRKNYIPFFTKAKDNNSQINERIIPPVEEWLKSFILAEFIITDSFHACVFSILFNKSFIAFGNRDRGLARFESLLRIFNLENRLITSSDGISEEILSDSIDWGNVNDILAINKRKSLQFLKQNLEA